MSGNDLKRWKYEVQIGFHTSYSSYLDAYHRAVDILFAQIEEKDLPANVVSYPLLYMVRHSLELGYKLNINQLSKYSLLGDEMNWVNWKGKRLHQLRELHKAFRLHFAAVVKELHIPNDIADEFKKRCKDLESLMRAFDDIDRGSFSFRYPEDTKQRIIFKHNETVNLLNVKILYDQAMILLS